MALDERYTRTLGEKADIRDVHGRLKTAGVGLENGRVIMRIANAWVSMPAAAAQQLGYYLVSTGLEAEQQGGGS
jgi:hypothetical protein